MKKALLGCCFGFLFLSGCAVDKESSSMFLAKEVCSCIFLVGRTESDCKDAIRPALALGDVDISPSRREVTGTAEDGSHPATFRFISNRAGCEFLR
jgi:hypothetical protein